jgi:hypothetical protein
METIRSSSRAQFAYEETQGIRVKPAEPTSEVESAEPTIEQVTLDTVVLYEADANGVEVFKFSFDKSRLAEFLAYYVEYLDADGRQLIRSELSKSSDVVVPGIEIPGVSTRTTPLRVVPAAE